MNIINNKSILNFEAHKNHKNYKTKINLIKPKKIILFYEWDF